MAHGLSRIVSNPVRRRLATAAFSDRPVKPLLMTTSSSRSVRAAVTAGPAPISRHVFAGGGLPGRHRLRHRLRVQAMR
ncbi:hypothetical protein [Nonomuraea dietziae]|uniref:hypothetical protein n=1 Tax=Nonomuraea dietziae TaxID=65515 RepID=UPI0031E18314